MVEHSENDLYVHKRVRILSDLFLLVTILHYSSEYDCPVAWP